MFFIWFLAWLVIGIFISIISIMLVIKIALAKPIKRPPIFSILFSINWLLVYFWMPFLIKIDKRKVLEIIALIANIAPMVLEPLNKGAIRFFIVGPNFIKSKKAIIGVRILQIGPVTPFIKPLIINHIINAAMNISSQ